jgi:2-(1,2-epoxy-1,2-dihydrophenyl)acetyl-CoA isomerase
VPDVLFEKRVDGVGLITLNRPESLNATGGQLVPLLSEYLDECERDPSVRCIAVTGEGRGFCAGGDLKKIHSQDPGGGDTSDQGFSGGVARLERDIAELDRVHGNTVLKIRSIPKPTVGLINGVAVGAGLGLALSFDIRIASDRARFGTAFKNIGLSGDYGVSYFLPRLVGDARARELFFTAELLDATRAMEFGLVNRVVPHEDLLSEGIAFCASLAAGPTAAFGRIKKNLDLADVSSLRESLSFEARNQRLSLISHDGREAVAAFVEKRSPDFRGE